MHKQSRAVLLSASSIVAVSVFAFGGCGSTDQESESGVVGLRLSSGSAEASLVKQSDWGSGYCADVTIKNLGASSVTSWSVVLNTPQATVSTVWNGTPTSNGASITVQSMLYNALIVPNGTASFGFCAIRNGSNLDPTLSVLNVDRPSSGTGGTSGSGGSGGVGGNGSATLSIQSDWGSGYCANVIVKNLGTKPSATWTVVLDAPTSTIGTLWKGRRTQSGSQVTVTPETYNAVIPPGGSTDFGFCAVTPGWDPRPRVVSVVVVPESGTGGTGGTSGGTGGTSSGGASPVGGAGGAVGGEGGATGGVGGVNGGEGGSTTGGEGGATGGEGGSTTGGEGGATGGEGGATGGEGGATGGEGGATGGEGGVTGGAGGVTGGAGGATGGSGGGSVGPSAALNVYSDWNSGYCATVTIENPSLPVVGHWRVLADLGQSAVGNMWNGSYSMNGTVMTVLPMSFNSVIPVGGNVQFGWCATKTGPNYMPRLQSLVATP